MVRGIRVTHPKARKKHRCRACEDLLNGASARQIVEDNYYNLNEEELAIMKKALIDDNGFIQPGEVHECQVNEYDGEIYTWRVKTDVYTVAEKHNLLSEND